MLTAFPLAAHASTTSTSPLPTSPTSSVSTTTKTVTSQVSSALPTTSLSAPVTSALAPKAAGTTTVVTVPAPASTADAYAAKVAGVIGISHTHASASGTGTSSTADPLELGGPNPPASQFGGTQNGPGSAHGALLDTGPSSQFRLALTPWAVSNTDNTASAISDIVLLDLGDQTTAQSASVRVLQSTSNATWSPAESNANASSDGAIIKAGGPSGLDVDLLHAETNTNGQSHSYLLSINGNEIGSSDQVNGQCTLTIPGLLSLSCLTATGGVANSIVSQAAGVVSVTLGGSPAGLNIGLIQSSSSSGAATTPSVSSGNGGTGSGNGNNNGSAGSGSQAAKAGSGSLAFTGSNSFALLLAALFLGLCGAALVLVTRRTRTTVA